MRKRTLLVVEGRGFLFGGGIFENASFLFLLCSVGGSELLLHAVSASLGGIGGLKRRITFGFETFGLENFGFEHLF